jgi:sugar lactone lactonase YvrE
MVLSACTLGRHDLTFEAVAPFVSTYAGDKSQTGNANGFGPSATFSSSTDGIAVDKSGNIYVADTDNGAIRKITPSGKVTTLASGFALPFGVAVDRHGTVYVADNGVVDKISPDGTVGTLVTGYPQIQGVAVDADGFIYVTYNLTSTDGVVERITPTGVATTVAGGFTDPTGLVVGPDKTVYLSDSVLNQVLKISPSGSVSLWAGSPGGVFGSQNGVGTGATFNGPWGLALDKSGNLYVGDTSNSMVRKISPDGTVTTFAGTGSQGSADGRGTVATFEAPYGVCVDSSGAIYVADNNNGLIRKIVVKPVL